MTAVALWRTVRDAALDPLTHLILLIAATAVFETPLLAWLDRLADVLSWLD